MTDDERFIEHLDECTRRVNRWPAHKKRVMRQIMGLTKENTPEALKDNPKIDNQKQRRIILD